LNDLPHCQHYYINLNEEEEEVVYGEGLQQEVTSNEHGQGEEEDDDGVDLSFTTLLQRPRIKMPNMSKAAMETQVDYHKSIILMNEQYMQELEVIATKREEAMHERKRRQLEREMGNFKNLAIFHMPFCH